MEQTREKEGQSRIEVFPEPALADESVIVEVLTERHYGMEVGDRNGREPGDKNQSWNQTQNDQQQEGNSFVGQDAVGDLRPIGNRPSFARTHFPNTWTSARLR